MIQPIAVVNAPPVYSLGLASALSRAKLQTPAARDVVDWAKTAGYCGVLFAVYDDADLDIVVNLSDSAPEAVVVTLLPDLTAQAIRESLQAGAFGTVSLDAQPADVAYALGAAMQEMTVLPAEFAQELAGHGAKLEASRDLSKRDRDWLRRLAGGSTVADLGEFAGYSTREMFRLLANLYRRMGVHNRTEAMVTAAQWGLL